MYCAYITTLKGLRKHSNADRLQCVEVFGQNVIVDLSYQEGQKVVFFPSDGQLSLEYATDNNLVRKKDENGNNIGGYMDAEKRNVTAIRLRGEKSEGLVLPVETLSKYTDISKLKDGDQIIEENRGKNKHGSCGLGIFETIKRYKAGITDVDNHIREYYLEQFEKENIILTDEWSRIFLDNGIFEHFLDDWDFMNNHSLAISDNYFLNQFDNIVFEAAQGLLLDQNNTEYFPHLTPSNTGIKNPKRIIENVEWNDEINIETCYVSRTYLTRHGAGKFPSECNKRFINEYMFDKTNVPNPFQDTLRYGTLDLGELYSRCSNDIGNFGDKKSIAITHCNEYDWDNDKLIELFKDWNIYYSDGETHNDVN